MKDKFLKILLVFALVGPIGLTPLLACACHEIGQNHDCCDDQKVEGITPDVPNAGQTCCAYQNNFTAKHQPLADLQLTVCFDGSLLSPLSNAGFLPSRFGDSIQVSTRNAHHPPSSIYLKNHSLLL